MSPFKQSNLKNAKNKRSLTVNMMAKVIYHIDETGDCRNNTKSKEFMKFKKLSEGERQKVTVFVKNAKKNGTPTSGKIENVKSFAVLTEKENDSLLQAVLPFLSKKPITSITTTSSKDSHFRSCIIYHFDLHDTNNQLYHMDIFQQFMVNMYDCALTFIKENMKKSSLLIFNTLYPNPLCPRYCFASSYSAGTKQGIPSHRDQVSFLSIVVALQGDLNESIDNCLRISTFWNHSKENSKYIRLGNGDAVIFERLYHSIVPTSNRMKQRVTINTFY